MRPYFWIVALLVLLFSGCKESAWEYNSTDFYFDLPQPEGKKELKSIPKKFHGIYFSAGDSLLQMVINDKLIFTFSHLSITEHKDILKDSLEEKFSYKSGKLYYQDITYDVEEKNDSLYLSATFSDTLFDLSASDRVKLLNGELILNRKDSVFWKINILNLRKDTLRWRHLSSKEDYLAVKSIVKDVRINADTTIIYIRPSKSEFKKIAALKVMGWDMTYKKLKKNEKFLF